MAQWRLVYTRADRRSILDELKILPDKETARSAVAMLEGLEDPAAARQALVGAFDVPEVSALQVYNIGDGAAMAGLIAAARYKTGEAVILIFLLD